MKRKTVVLGAELAAAHRAENERLEMGTPATTPLTGRGYDPDRGELDLLTFVEAPLDGEIDRFVEQWRRSGPEERALVRQSLDLGDNYTLIEYARRATVRSLAETDSNCCELGLCALAMIDPGRIDTRDALWAGGLLNHAASSLVEEPALLFERACSLAAPGMAELLSGVRGTELTNWGYLEWKTETGVGLIRSGTTPYSPTVDLAALALRIGARLPVDRYRAEVQIADEVPVVWFDRAERERAELLLARCSGVSSVHGALRRHVGSFVDHLFVVWLAELPAEEHCVRLVRSVGTLRTPPERYAVGASVGRIFALIVAGSTAVGVSSIESAQSVAEFGRETERVLRDFGL